MSGVWLFISLLSQCNVLHTIYVTRDKIRFWGGYSFYDTNMIPHKKWVVIVNVDWQSCLNFILDAFYWDPRIELLEWSLWVPLYI